jgi:uncharacterized membrane protein
MGVIVGIIVILIALGILSSLIERSVASRLLRPYIGLLLIAALIAALGVAVGTLFSGLDTFFFFISKIVAVLACADVCLHLIAVVARRWL